MPDRSRHRSRLHQVGLGAVAAALLSLVVGSITFAAGPTITVEPAGPLSDVDQTITVRGTGFDPEANNGFGVYVVFGPRTEAPTYYSDAELYGAARWVHVGASDSPGQAALAADGSFETTLDIQPRYTDGHDTAVDCTVADCHVITMAAHGAPDRSQDTFTAIAFEARGDDGGIPWILPVAVLAGALAIVGGVVIRRQGSRTRPGEESP
jgi:hypothetical protein